MLAVWSHGRRERPVPGALRVGKGGLLVGPPHGEFTSRQTDRHQKFMGLGITLRPIHNRAGWVDQAALARRDGVGK